MRNDTDSSRGFTLIELLIVVALIGILSSIAFTQFMSFKQKGYNSTAVSDLKNAKTVLEAYFAENHCFP